MGHSPLDRFTRIKHPVARDEDLLVEHVADETVVYDNRTKEAHCLSPLAAVVFAHCDGRTTVDQLAGLATERLGEPVDSPRVIDALAQLQERDLLAVPPRDGLSRRQMIGKSAAVAGGFAGASLITSIVAPAAIASQTATCFNLTCCPCCTDNTLNIKECCSGPGTVNCQCSGNQRFVANTTTLVSGGKWCKPAGETTEFQDQICQQLYNSAGKAAECTANQQYPARPGPPPVPAGRGFACTTCNPSDPTVPPSP